MARFHYKAATRDGGLVEGELEAPDEAHAVARLQLDGHIPIRVGSTAALRWSLSARGRRPRQQHVEAFTQELATLLGAGLPLDRGLEILGGLAEDDRMADVISRLRDKVREGSALSDALASERAAFSRFYVNMVHAGEMGGSLEQVLVRLSEYLSRARELRETVTSALIYPAILAAVSVASVLVLMVFVVPQFRELFDDAGRALPLLTQVVLGTAELVRQYWWVPLAALLLALAWLRKWLRDPPRRVRWDRLLLRLPLAGGLLRKLEAARFSRTLGTLLGNGVSLLAAFAIVRETLTNRALAEDLGQALEGLRAGRGMSRALIEAGLFPSLGLQMIRVGEETGQLERMLLRVAELYEAEVRRTVQRLLALVEPVLIIGLGLVIALIIVSILVAIMSVNELAF